MIKELNSSLKILKKGQTLLYPTDTVWGIGCDATNFDAVQKIYQLKQREDSKTMICFCTKKPKCVFTSSMLFQLI